MVCAKGVFRNVPNSYTVVTLFKAHIAHQRHFLYTLHSPQVMLWGLKQAERLHILFPNSPAPSRLLYIFDFGLLHS